MKQIYFAGIVMASVAFHFEQSLAGSDGIAAGAPPELAHWSKLIGDWVNEGGGTTSGWLGLGCL